MRLFFTGDLMLGGEFISQIFTDKNIEYSILNRLKKADYIITNFEHVIGRSFNLSEKRDALLFCSLKTFKSYINVLTNSIFCIGNNHITDFGEIAFNNTKNLFNRNNIKYYGAGYLNEVKKPLVIEEKVLLLNFSTKDPSVESEIATNDEIGVLSYDLNNIDKIIRDIDASNKILIITIHWGYENVILPSPEQINIAHHLIDIGADIIIGHHPHIIQPFEIYKNKYIFYSLGNYFFSNFYHFKSGMYFQWQKRNFHSVLIQIDIQDIEINNLEILGIFLDEKKFKVRSSKASENFLRNISKSFSYINKNRNYDEFFKQYLSKYYKVNFKFTILRFFLYFFLILNIFSKNDIKYKKRILKLFSFKKFRLLIRYISKSTNWLNGDKKEIYKIVNIRNFSGK